MSLNLCDLQVRLGGQYSLFVNQDVISQYSGSLKKMIKKTKKKRNKTETVRKIIEIDDFPGGSDGLELVLRFCYSNGRIAIDVTNVSLLYCCSVFLEMTEEFSSSNLLLQAQKFLEGLFINWSWNDILICLKSCERTFAYADSYGLVQKLICAVLAKIIDQNSSDVNGFVISPSSSSSSPETTARGQPRFSLSSRNTTPESTFSWRTSKEWWFDDLMILGPQIIEKLIKNLGRRGYGSNEDSLIITRFLLQYLKTRVQYKSNRAELMKKKQEYGGLADRAVQGVIFEGKSAFSCRKLFWILSVFSEFSISRESRMGLETLIGEILDQATLDDLLISGCSTDDKCFYNVDLVIRILKVFVSNSQESRQNLKTMGNLIDKYLREISPDQNLKVLKFVGVAESLPDSARDCFDGVYRAIDIYLESHPYLSSEERTKLCRSLNYEKLTLETCKDLAKNPKIPPNVAVQALKSQHFRIPKTRQDHQYTYDQIAIPIMDERITSCHDRKKSSEIRYSEGFEDKFEEEGEDVRMNLERMQWRVGELEKVCKDMKVRMSKLASHGHTHSSGSPQNRALPRLC